MLVRLNLIRGFLILPIACIGVYFNWTVVIVTNKISVLKHSFGYLSTNQAIGDAIHSTAFLVYIFPMLIFDSEVMKEYSNHCGAVLLFCYELSVQTHFLIALNRFFAAFTPIWYNTLFSDRNTKCFIVFIWMLTSTTTLVYYEILCSFTFSDETGFFVFTDSPVCSAISWYTDFCKYLVLVIIIVVIDISTVIKVRYVKSKVRNVISFNSSSQSTKREMNFLKQTVFQGSIFALELITYFILPGYLKNQWHLFFSTSFAWVAVHAADGVVTTVCNPEYKKYVLTSWKGGNNSSGPTALTDNRQKSGTILGSSTAAQSVHVIT